MATILKKLGAKQIVGNVANVLKELSAEGKALEKDGAKIELYRVFGIAEGVKTGETTFGPWTAFVGQCEAVSYTGEVFRANQSFLPPPLDEMLATTMRSNEGDSIQYGVIVYLKRRDDLERGYEYNVEPIIEESQADPLAALRSKVVPQLAAPADDGAKAASEPAEKPAPKKAAK